MPDLPIWLWIAASALAGALLVALFLKGWNSWSTVAEGACQVDEDEWEEWAGVCPHTHDDQYVIRRRTDVSFSDGRTFSFSRSLDTPLERRAHAPRTQLVGEASPHRLHQGRHLEADALTPQGVFSTLPSSSRVLRVLTAPEDPLESR